MRGCAGGFVGLTAALGAAAAFSACTVTVPLTGVSSEEDAAAQPPAPSARDTGVADASESPPDALVARDSGGGEMVSCESRDVWLDPYSMERPQMFVAVGRSLSMLMKTFGTKHLRDAVRDELVPALGDLEGGVRFGYLEFPAHGACNPAAACCSSGIVLFPSTYRAGDILAQLTCPKGAPASACFEAAPDNPIADALVQVRIYKNRMVDSSNSQSFVLLITDGSASCGSSTTSCDDAVAEATRLNDTLGIATIVVGVGDGAKPPNPCLEKLAQAGMGPMRPAGMPAYIAVSQPSDLKPAIKEALAPLLPYTCRLVPTGRGAVNGITVFFHNQVLTQVKDSPEGWWEFDAPNSEAIRIHGKACDSLRAGFKGAAEVDVQQRCMRCNGRTTCPP
jgi:hypothetical protein